MKYILVTSLLLAGCGANDPGLAKTIGITKDQRAAIEARICSYDGNDCFLPIMVNIEGGTQVAAVEALPGKQNTLPVALVTVHKAVVV